jgi:hypothetical protein
MIHAIVGWVHKTSKEKATYNRRATPIALFYEDLWLRRKY